MTWREGDPVGCGEVYLSDTKTRRAYGRACRDAVIDGAARQVIRLPTLQARRDLINAHPAKEQLKARVLELWEAKDG